MYTIINVPCQNYQDQNPGTSGLRKKIKVFQQQHYLQSYTQAIFNAIEIAGKSIVIGGDGRYYNKEALQIIVAMLIANGAAKVFITQEALLSTPAASNIIRKYKLDFGIILSASHNPAGPNGDFGIKLNGSNGAPAGVNLTKAIYEETLKLKEFKTIDNFNIDISKLGETKALNTNIMVIDAIKDYVELMAEIFDFELISKYIKTNKFKFLFNAFYGITSPYAKEIFINRLGLSEEYLTNNVSKEDFGGLIPDPNPITAKEFVAKVRSDKNITLGLACDGDGDRNFIFSHKHYLEPSDSLALILEHANLLPYYAGKVYGVARSKATSSAVDLVAKKLGIHTYIVPTGWKYFSNLLDAKKITLCGEESFGTGSNHVREKDGLWAVLCWLNIIAATGKSLDDLIHNMWEKYGRVYYTRYDFENIDSNTASNMLHNLRGNTIKSVGKEIKPGFILLKANDFEYTDIVDGTKVDKQGFVITFSNGAEIIIRTSGTGTQGVTIRVYIHQLENKNIFMNKSEYLDDLVNVFYYLLADKIKPTMIV
jgi:phosphoglucomutase